MYIPSLKEIQEPYFHRAKVKAEPINYDFNSLRVGKIFALKEDGDLLNKLGFNSLGEAVKFLDLKKFSTFHLSGNVRFEYISRYINLNQFPSHLGALFLRWCAGPVKTESGSFYFVANPLTLENRKNWP